LKDKDKLPAKQSQYKLIPMQESFAPQIALSFKPVRARLFCCLNASKVLENTVHQPKKWKSVLDKLMGTIILFPAIFLLFSQQNN